MSSSSTTAASRSPSPSPATPESSDNLEPVVHQGDISRWCHSLPPGHFLAGEGVISGDQDKRVDGHVLELEDLLQDGAYADHLPVEAYAHPEANPVIVSNGQSLIAGSEHFGRPRGLVPMTRPVPPPPSALRKDYPPTTQRVVFPPKDTCYNLPIIVPSIPEGGTKSRVETQVRLTVDLAHASSSSGDPLKYDRVGSWKWLRLPKGTTTKKRSRKEGKIDAPPEDTLLLMAEVTCASPPHTRVTCCSSCQAREAKRVARKIAARVRPARSDDDSQDEPPTIPGRGRHEDTSNVVQFNCPEVLDFSVGSVILPLRITCYCRHHREKVGFNVRFTMLDHTGCVIGTGITRPIMITDDHKSTGANTKPPPVASNIDTIAEGDSSVGDAPQTLGSAKRKKCRGRMDDTPERMRKRTKPYDRVPADDRRLSTSGMNSPVSIASAFATRSPTPSPAFVQTPPMQHAVCEQPSPVITDASTHASPSSILNAFDLHAALNDQMGVNFDPNVILPDCQQQFDAMTIEQLTNTYLSTPSSPLSIPSALDPALTMNVPAQSTAHNLFVQDAPPPTSLPTPRIHRLIPSSGPTFGGIEITVLGANFHPSMQLNCVFGGVPSSSTQRWSDNTLVCVLPPSPCPGVVPVWFEGIPKEEDGGLPCVFTYTDETDRALMELALQVVGLKMTGKIEDARNVAMRIVNTTGPSSAEIGMNDSPDTMQLSDRPLFDVRHLLLSRATDTGDFEKLILDFLSILDVSLDTPTATVSSAISHKTASGQTLLHLATISNFPSLIQFLLKHDVDVDARDNNGCTALFFAALLQSTECADLLVEAGADIDIVDAHGKTPVEVASVGFFDSLPSCAVHSGTGEEDEEAEWGDVEEEADDELERRLQAKRRADRLSAKRSLAFSEKTREEDDETFTPASKEKAIEAGLANEKQVATFMETVYRTLTQLQRPANIPVWDALPQMPMVFPMLAPSFAGLWREKGIEGQQFEAAGKDTNGQAWLGMLSPQDWRAALEKWMTQATTGNPGVESVDTPPPAYSPRCLDEDGVVHSVEEMEDEEPSVAQYAAVERTAPRPLVYDAVPVPEQEVNSYEYRPTRKSTRTQEIKHDHMLWMVWIPILLIGVAWAFLHAVCIAFRATKTVVGLKLNA